MDYTVKREVFDYFGEKRKRPIRVKGYVPTQPHNSPGREDVQPLALQKGTGGFADFPPHNTVRGHLIGLDSLGGEEVAENLVPMYGQFNLSTYKTKFENVLKNKVQRSGIKEAELDLTIEYGTQNADPRIPIAFSFVLKITANNEDKESISDRIPHPAPEAAYVDTSTSFQKYVKRLQAAMEKAKWFVEDHVVNRQDSSKHFEHGWPLVVPDKSFEGRPYAVIDYALWKKDYTHFGSGCGPELYNGGGFNQNQIDAILAVNAVRNEGYYKSDDRNDYVYDGNRDFFKRPDRVDDYYLHAHACAGKKDGVLIMEGYHQKPEIDHIVPKGRHINPGCNACSNARVISRYLNSEDRGKYAL